MVLPQILSTTLKISMSMTTHTGRCAKNVKWFKMEQIGKISVIMHTGVCEENG
jgi:hypothetical protein